MSIDNEQLVTAFCMSFQSGDMAKVVSYLADHVLYHNIPWKPVTGHEGVRKVLDPFLHGSNCALTKMEIKHTTSSGHVVMNERLETWEKRDVKLELPVVGVFEIEDGKITKWRDYFESTHLTPLMAAMKGS